MFCPIEDRVPQYITQRAANISALFTGQLSAPHFVIGAKKTTWGRAAAPVSLSTCCAGPHEESRCVLVLDHSVVPAAARNVVLPLIGPVECNAVIGHRFVAQAV